MDHSLLPQEPRAYQMLNIICQTAELTFFLLVLSFAQFFSTSPQFFLTPRMSGPILKNHNRLGLYDFGSLFGIVNFDDDHEKGKCKLARHSDTETRTD